MGAIKEQSTLSIIGLLTNTTETAWAVNSQCVVSMLSLDISRAFDHVSHKCLLFILRSKGIPEWMVKTIKSLLTQRGTKIIFPGHHGEFVETSTGIPQGSPLSPILFLFYISELLEEYEDLRNQGFGFGFVDDTNLITWSQSAQENCNRLSAMHEKCTKGLPDTAPVSRLTSTS